MLMRHLRYLLCLACLGLLQAAPAAAADSPASWQARCQPDLALESVDFASQSGDVAEDDFVVHLNWRNGQRTRLALPGAWYLQTEALSRHGGVCSDIGAARLPHHTLLLVLPWSGRPGFDRLSVVAVDLQTRQVRDIQADIGEISPDYRAEVQPERYSLYAIKNWLVHPDGRDEVQSAWLDITVREGKIVRAWRP